MDEIIITLENESGSIECKVISFFDVDERGYCALLPMVDGSDEIILYEYRFKDKAEEDIELIDLSEEECQKVLKVFNDLIENPEDLEEQKYWDSLKDLEEQED